MHRTALPAVSLGILVGIAGRSGFFGPSTANESTPPIESGSADSSYEELENATLWIDGRVERIENQTVYIDDQGSGNVVVPVTALGSGASYCHARNDTRLDWGPIQVDEDQPDQEVCSIVHPLGGTLSVIKLFFNATCGGPQASPE